MITRVYVSSETEGDDHEADMVLVRDTKTGGLTVERYSVDADGEMVGLGATGYAQGYWRRWSDIVMPTPEVRGFLRAAEEREEASALRTRIGRE